MYEKESKLSQPAPILENNRMLLIEILMKNAPFFFWTLIFDGCSGKYRLNVQRCPTLPLLSRICPASSTTWILNV